VKQYLNHTFSVQEITEFLNEVKNQDLLMVPLVQTFGHMEVLTIELIKGLYCKLQLMFKSDVVFCTCIFGIGYFQQALRDSK
jgi:hypothetical protein